MKQLKNLMFSATASVLMLAGSTALAHNDEAKPIKKAANGGQSSVAGIYHFELVVAKDSTEAKDNPVTVYVTDHAGSKVSTVGAGGTATILGGKIKTSVTLTPDGDNHLRGIGKYASTPDMKVVVSVTLAGKAAEQARFTPLAPVAPSAAVKDGHKDHQH